MLSSSFLLLLGAAAVVAILHSILPDHWIPLAVVARTQRWNLLQVGRVTLLASLGHVVASLFFAGLIALIGLQFQQELDTQQGHIVGGILVLTGLIFFIWDVFGKGSHKHGLGSNHTHVYGVRDNHDHDDHHYDDLHCHTHDDDDSHGTVNDPSQASSLAKQLVAIAVSFGVAASPDLTILPVAFAASAVGTGAVIGVLSIFALFTIITFIVLTLVATLVGYQIKGAWLEKNAGVVTSLILIAFGLVAFVGF